MSIEMEPAWVEYLYAISIYESVLLQSGELCVSTIKNGTTADGYATQINELWVVDADNGQIRKKVQLSEPTGWDVTSLANSPSGDILVLLKDRGMDESKFDVYSSDSLTLKSSIKFGQYYSIFVSATDETAHLLESGDHQGGEPEWQRFVTISLTTGEFLQHWPSYERGIQDIIVAEGKMYALLNHPVYQPQLAIFDLEHDRISFVKAKTLEFPGVCLTKGDSVIVAMGQPDSGNKLVSFDSNVSTEWQESVTGNPRGLLYYENYVYLVSAITSDDSLGQTLVTKYSSSNGDIAYRKKIDGDASGLLAANKRFLFMAVAAPESNDMFLKNQILGLNLATGEEIFRVGTLDVLTSNLILQNSRLLYSTTRSIGAVDLAKRWSVRLGSSMRVQPAVDAQIVLITTASGEVRCLDSINGRELWVVSGEPRSRLKPVLSSVAVFAAMGDQLLALDRDSGRELWRYQTESPIAVDLSLNGAESEFLTVGTSDGSVMVFGATTGELFTPPQLQFRTKISTSVLAKANQIVIGMETGHVIAQKFDGTLSWILPRRIHGICGLAYHTNKVIVLDSGGTLSAHSLTSGEDFWALRLDRDLNKNGIYFIDENRIVVVDSGGVVYVVDARDGSIVWRSNPLGENMSLPSIVTNGLITISSEGTVFILDPSSGSVVDTFYSGVSLASPVGSNSNVVVFADEGGNLHRLLM